MAPTYLYMVVIFGVIAWGLFQAVNGTLGTFVPPPAWVEAEGEAVTVLSVFLVLRAFSSGAAALTGVEAVSDGVPAFKAPEWRNARTTLTWAAILFGALFLGISYLASVIHVVPGSHRAADRPVAHHPADRRRRLGTWSSSRSRPRSS